MTLLSLPTCQRTCGNKFSKVLNVWTLYSEYIRAINFENLCQGRSHGAAGTAERAAPLASPRRLRPAVGPSTTSRGGATGRRRRRSGIHLRFLRSLWLSVADARTCACCGVPAVYNGDAGRRPSGQGVILSRRTFFNTAATACPCPRGASARIGTDRGGGDRRGDP